MKLESAKNEIVVLTGIPGSGKTTLAMRSFSKYNRINLDALKSRNKEKLEICASLGNSRSIIIDNTNMTRQARKRYIEIAKSHGTRIRSIYLNCPLEMALKRNAGRTGRERVPDHVVRFYNRILQVPTIDEGFDSVEVLGGAKEIEEGPGRMGTHKRRKIEEQKSMDCFLSSHQCRS